MPICPNCGATVPEGAVYCGNCGAAINAPTASMSTTAQTRQTSSQPTAWPREGSGGDMQARYEKAMRRAEQLGYAMIGVGVVIIVVLVFYIF